MKLILRLNQTILSNFLSHPNPQLRVEGGMAEEEGVEVEEDWIQALILQILRLLALLFSPFNYLYIHTKHIGILIIYNPNYKLHPFFTQNQCSVPEVKGLIIEGLRIYHSGFYSDSHSDPWKFLLNFTL